MKISAIITYHDETQYIREGVESVLNQTYPAAETIVVDDGSATPATAVLADLKERLIIIRQENRGISAARNTGIEAATGDALSFLDADDYWPPERLETQVALFELHPDAEIVMGTAKPFISPELDEATKARLYCPPEPIRAQIVTGMLVRRHVFSRIDPVSEDKNMHDQIEFIASVHDAGINIVEQSDIAFYRRMHKSNAQPQHMDKTNRYLRSLKATIDRRRES